jgi:hypothetical protein
MKKISLYITILFRKITNEKIDAKELAQEIFNGLIDNKDDVRTLELIKALEEVFKTEMRKKEIKQAAFCKSVNEKWKPEVTKVYNLYTDTKPEYINVKYELVK